MGPLLRTISIKLHSPSCVHVAIKCAVVTLTQFPCTALRSSTLPFQVLNIRLYRIDDNCYWADLYNTIREVCPIGYRVVIGDK